MTTEPPVLSAPPFRDRSGGLVGFGIVQIIVGAFCALMVPFMMFAMLIPKPPDQENVGPGIFVMGMLIYGVMAIAIIWLGIGSIKAQRWARTLTMVVSWSTLFYGVIMLPVMVAAILFMPLSAANGQEIPPSAKIFVLVFAGGFAGTFFILLPGLMAWFYSRADVRATCETRHPWRSWTDACPPTVLLLSLWQIFGGAMFLILILTNYPALPMFGQILSGWTSVPVGLVLTVLMCGGGWLLYRLKAAGWWLTLGVVLLYVISGVMNALWLDYGDMYRAMGYSDARVEQMAQVGNFMHGPLGIVMIFVGFLPMVVLLGYIRKYFVKRG